MAQFNLNPITNRLDLVGSSSGGSGVEGLYTDNDTTATPTGGLIKLSGAMSSVDNENELTTSASGSILTISLTNRFRGGVVTTGADSFNAVTLAASVTGNAYVVQSMVIGRDRATGDSAAFFFNTGFKTDGTNTSFIGGSAPTATSTYTDASMATATAEIQCQDNNFAIVVTGIAATTIDWDTTSYYIPLL